MLGAQPRAWCCPPLRRRPRKSRAQAIRMRTSPEGMVARTGRRARAVSAAETDGGGLAGSEQALF